MVKIIAFYSMSYLVISRGENRIKKPREQKLISIIFIENIGFNYNI